MSGYWPGEGAAMAEYDRQRTRQNTAREIDKAHRRNERLHLVADNLRLDVVAVANKLGNCPEADELLAAVERFTKGVVNASR